MPPFNNSINRAAIVIPPIEDFYCTPHRISSLGVGILKQILENENFNYIYINALENPIRVKRRPLLPALSYLQPYILPEETGKCSYFTNFRYYGKSYEVIVEEICAFDPAICFIGCFAFCYCRPVIEISRRIRQRLPQTIIVAGGAGVSVYPEYFLRETAIDYTLSGEAEINLMQFINFIRDDGIPCESITGLGWKKGPLPICNPVDKITTAATIMPVFEKIIETPTRMVYSLSLSRGCPSTCRFCANHLAHGRQFRHCTVGTFDRLLKQMPHPANGKEIRCNFEDDNLLHDTCFLVAILDSCRKAFPGVVRFSAENGLDYRLLTSELCDRLIDMGFRQFNFTLGSVSSEMLGRSGRAADIDRYDRLISIAWKRGVPVITYVICGFPEETKESIADNLRFLISRNTVIGVSLFYPVPGIPGFENRKAFDKVPPQLCAGASAYSWSSRLTTQTLVTAFRLARLINLMKAAVKSEEESVVIQKTINSGRLHTIIKECSQRRIIEVPRQDAELVGMVLGG